MYVFIGFDGCLLNKYFVGAIELIDILQFKRLIYDA